MPDIQTILNIVTAATALTKSLSSLVDNATAVFKDDDADRVRAAANALQAETDKLAQVVLAKLG